MTNRINTKKFNNYSWKMLLSFGFVYLFFYNGRQNINFCNELYSTVVKILDSKEPLEIYSIFQLVRFQLILETRKQNSIQFINEKLLLKLKSAILENREFFESYNGYEAFMSKDGMMGRFRNWDNQVSVLCGRKIL